MCIRDRDRGKRSGRGAGPRGADHSRGVGGGSSLENLIDSGNEHLAMDRVREGLADLRRACALVPDSADAWDAYGIALAEFGPNPDDAVKVLKRAAQLSPDLGYEKFMYGESCAARFSTLTASSGFGPNSANAMPYASHASALSGTLSLIHISEPTRPY